MEDDEKFVCQCFFTHNIFLKKYKVHVIFKDDGQFIREFRKILRAKGCVSDEQWESVLLKVRKEVDRRKALGKESRQRKQAILSNYRPKHPHIYCLKESYLAKPFINIVKFCKSKDVNVKELLVLLQKCNGDQIYRFPVFTQEFCSVLLEELNHFEASDLPRGRPNTMNNYGILLNELGFDDGFLTPLRTDYLMPIAKVFYPTWGGDSLDSHKAFTVQYKTGQDVDLSYHYDNSEVTLNVCLGKEFSGGELYFGDMRQASTQETQCTREEHLPSYGILHRGQHMHGAMPIMEGERCNLIIWMRSSTIRNTLCPMCNQKPVLVRTVGDGDGFTDNSTIQVCTTL